MTRKGFTLVEVLMTALIATLIGGALLVVAIAGRRVSDLTNARLTTMTNAQQAMNYITRDLRGTIDPRSLVCRANDGRLRFPDSTGGFTISYTFQSGQLKRTGAGDPDITFTGVSDFQFVCSSAGEKPKWVRIQVTARADSGQESIKQTVTSQVQLRNPA